MPIIAILNPKGGSAKTTLATNLARACHDRGLKTLLVDSDPQGSAADWHAAREDNPLPFFALPTRCRLRQGAGLSAPGQHGVANLLPPIKP